MKNKPLLFLISLLVAAVAGAGAVYVLFPPASEPDVPEEAEAVYEQTAAPAEPLPTPSSISTIDMEKASLPQGVSEKDPVINTVQKGTDLPSQLSKIKISGVVGVAPKPLPEEASALQQETGAGAVPAELIQKAKRVIPYLPEEALTVAASEEPSLAEEPSSITMLEAPVKVRLIKNTQEYKDFKTIARGKYPQVDFNKQMIVVLESDSNLPDKVFEIQKAEQKSGKLLVTYRVNVFGLEDKLNTHSVYVVKKTSLPVELKQVL